MNLHVIFSSAKYDEFSKLSANLPLRSIDHLLTVIHHVNDQTGILSRQVGKAITKRWEHWT